MDETLRSQHEDVDRVLGERTAVKDSLQVTKIDKLRTMVKQVGHGLVDVIPEGVERDQAVLSLRQVLLWLEAGTELNQPDGIPRISAARIDEATAVRMRDGSTKLPGEV